MSWLFSRALVEGFLHLTYSDGDLSWRLNMTPTPQAFLSLDKMMGRSHLFRYGMTFAHLTASRGAGVLTWYLAAFPARHIPRRLQERTLRTISGRKCDGSWQMSLPGSYLPRTSSGEPLSARPTTLKRWVTTPDACRFPRETWVLTTFGGGTGYLHTPTCTANYAAPSMQKHACAREFVRVFGKPTPTNHEWLQGWPIGWSGLEPLETGSLQQWQQMHFLPSYEHLTEETAA